MEEASTFLCELATEHGPDGLLHLFATDAE
jgi:hypothetical protein